MKPPQGKGKPKLPPPPPGGRAAARLRQSELERGKEAPEAAGAGEDCATSEEDAKKTKKKDH